MFQDLIADLIPLFNQIISGILAIPLLAYMFYLSIFALVLGLFKIIISWTNDNLGGRK